MVNVYCPHCGQTFPYSLVARQVAKVKFNHKILTEIIKEKKQLIIGELAQQYQEKTGEAIGIRTLGYFLKKLKNAKVVQLKVISCGRYGRSTRITYTGNPIPKIFSKIPEVVNPKIIPVFKEVMVETPANKPSFRFDGNKFVVQKVSVGGNE
jgi:hypothetical protein